MKRSIIVGLLFVFAFLIVPERTYAYSVSYEAEDGENTNCETRIYNSSNCSNGKCVGWLGYGRYLVFNNVYAPREDVFFLQIDYICGENRKLKLMVNNEIKFEFTLNSGGIHNIGKHMIQIPLKKGNNSIKLYNDMGWGPDIDKITISDCNLYNVKINNIENDITISYSLLIIRGHVSCTYDKEKIKISLTGGEKTEWSVNNSDKNYNALIELLPGKNIIRIEYKNHKDKYITINYNEKKTGPKVRMNYLYAPDNNMSSEELDVIKKQLSLQIRLIQSAYAELMNDRGYGRQTFRIQENSTEEDKNNCTFLVKTSENYNDYWKNYNSYNSEADNILSRIRDYERKKEHTEEEIQQYISDSNRKKYILFDEIRDEQFYNRFSFSSFFNDIKNKYVLNSDKKRDINIFVTGFSDVEFLPTEKDNYYVNKLLTSNNYNKFITYACTALGQNKPCDDIEGMAVVDGISTYLLPTSVEQLDSLLYNSDVGTSLFHSTMKLKKWYIWGISFGGLMHELGHALGLPDINDGYDYYKDWDTEKVIKRPEEHDGIMGSGYSYGGRIFACKDMDNLVYDYKDNGASWQWTYNMNTGKEFNECEILSNSHWISDVPYYKVEAESIVINKPNTGFDIERDDACSGKKYVGSFGYNDTLTYKRIWVDQAGEYTLRITYKSGERRYVYLSINNENGNGSKQYELIPFYSCGNWDTIGVKKVKVILNKGYNCIELSGQNPNNNSYVPNYWCPDIDKFEIYQ